LATHLLGKHGNPYFDKVTKTKTVSSLIENLDLDGIVSFVETLKKTFYAPIEVKSKDKLDAAAFRKAELARQWAMDNMVQIVKNKRIPKNAAVITDISHLLLFHSFYTPSSESKDAAEPPKKKSKKDKSEKSDSIKEIEEQLVVPLSSESKTACHVRLLKLLTDFSSTFTTPLIFSKEETTSNPENDENQETEEAVTGATFLRDLIAYVQQVESSSAVKLDKELTKEQRESRKSLVTIIEKIQADTPNAEPKSRRQRRAFELLLLNIFLQYFFEPSEAASVTADSISCYNKVFEESKKKKATEELDPVSVLVDVLLSLLAKNSHYLRVVCTKVFTVFREQLTLDALNLLLNILEPQAQESDDEGSESDNESASNKSDSEDGGSGSESEDDGSGSESEDEDDEKEGADGEPESDEDEEFFDEGDDGEDVDDEFRQKVKEALGQYGVENGNNNDEEDEEDEEDDDNLDDNDMLVFDKKIEAIFRERKKLAQEKKAEKPTQLAFKFKALELIEIYVERKPQITFLFAIIPVLLRLARDSYVSNEQQLGDKASNVLKSFTKGRPSRPLVPEEVEAAHTLLFELLAETGTFSEGLASLLSRCVTYLTNALTNTGNKDQEFEDVSAALDTHFLIVCPECVISLSSHSF